jgi:flagellar hook assembly protein FlgD
VTEIVYFIPERETSGVPVELVIYDMRGRLIRKFSEGTRKPGKHTIIWDGKDSRGGHVGSGVYLYLLKAGEYEGTRKMVLMR